MARMKKTMNPVVGSERTVYRQVLTITEPNGHSYETDPVDYPSPEHAKQAKDGRMWMLQRGTTITRKVVKITTIITNVEQVAIPPNEWGAPNG